MIKDMGFSEFVLLVNDTNKTEFDNMAERFNSVVDIVGEYDITTKDNKYWVIQLEAMFENRSAEELCRLIYTYFPFIAMRQSGSTFILVSDKDSFKSMLNDAYTKERKVYFLYDMLSIGDRYDASCCTGVEIDPYSDNRLMHYAGGAMYSLVYGKECVFLFTSESEISIMDETTGELKELDIIDGLWAFKFHIAILS